MRAHLFIHLPKILAFKYRDRVSIILDILACLMKGGKGEKKTRIMQNANLSFNQVNRYLELMLASGYVEIDSTAGLRGSSMIKITDRGMQFLRILRSQQLELK